MSIHGSHRLRRHHLVDALLVLLGQDGEFARLLVLQGLEHGFVLVFRRHLELVVPQRLVLLRLHFTRVLKLLLYLQLHHLGQKNNNNNNNVMRFL